MSKAHDKQVRPHCAVCLKPMGYHCNNAGCDSWRCEQCSFIQAPGLKPVRVPR